MGASSCVIPLQQVGSSLARSSSALLLAPGGHGLMITAEQHLWDHEAAILGRPGVLRKLQQSSFPGKRIMLAALLVAQHSRDQTDHRVDHRHGGDLASVEDEIAD